MHPTRAAHTRWIPTSPGRARGRGASLAAVSLALALTLLGADAARASSLAAPVLSSSPRATVPMTVSISGTADPSATLRVYIQQGAGGCATDGTGPEKAQAQSLRPGSTEVIAQQPTGPFAYSATYTPPVAGGYFVCAYLFGSTAGAGVSQTSMSFAVGPAPPPAATPAPAPGAPGTPGATVAPAKKRCVVPTLKGRTYFGARLLIRRAGCSVGSVFRPDLRTSRRERARGRVLRVVTQYPKPHAIRVRGGRVTLRLGYVRPKRARI
jgi:hypothetical protein